ncbi:MAG: hypothetical protein ACTSUE_03220 [Promethearchaeota archaeon]
MSEENIPLRKIIWQVFQQNPRTPMSLKEITEKAENILNKGKKAKERTVLNKPSVSYHLKNLISEDILDQKNNKDYYVKSDEFVQGIILKYIQENGFLSLDVVTDIVKKEPISEDVLKRETKRMQVEGLVYGKKHEDSWKIFLGPRGAKILNCCPICLKTFSSNDEKAILETESKVREEDGYTGFYGWESSFIHVKCAIDHEIEKSEEFEPEIEIPKESCDFCHLPLSPTVLIRLCAKSEFYTRNIWKIIKPHLDYEELANLHDITHLHPSYGAIKRALMAANEENKLYHSDVELIERSKELYKMARDELVHLERERERSEKEILLHFYGFTGYATRNFLHNNYPDSIERPFKLQDKGREYLPGNQNIIPIKTENEKSYHPCCWERMKGRGH